MGVISYGTKAAIEHKLHEHAVKSGVTKAGKTLGQGQAARAGSAASAPGRALTAAQRNRDAARAVYSATFGGKPPPARMSARGMLERVKGATVKNLRSKALQRGVVGATRMTKPELVAALYGRAASVAPQALTVMGRLSQAAALIPGAGLGVTAGRLAAGSVLTQGVAAYREGDQVFGLFPGVSKATSVVMEGGTALAIGLTAARIGMPLAGAATLAAVVGQSAYRESVADKDSSLRGAGRGVVKALDPTQLFMDKGALVRGYDSAFGTPSTWLSRGKPGVFSTKPPPSPGWWPLSSTPTPDRGAAYINASAAQSGGASAVKAQVARMMLAKASQPMTDGMTAGYQRVDQRTGKVVTVKGYETPTRSV